MGLEPSEETKAAQRDAQRLLGRCILRLQQYERLLKALLVDHEISGPAQDHGRIRAKRESQTARKTLGTLVGEFMGSYLVAGDPQDVREPAEDRADGPPTVSFRLSVVLTVEDHAQTASDLKELVDLRNRLVHHFVDEHDLWSFKGCRRAQGVLVEAYVRIDASYGRLVEIATTHDATRLAMVEILQSEEYRALVSRGVPSSG